jgi:hypothetical protein
VRIDGAFGDWEEVQPEFRDTIGDPVRREHRGWDAAVTYVNRTGRNDLVVMKVSHDAAHLQFYARTRTPLTPWSDPAWMMLFIDVDGDAATGWLGYDYVVNRAGVTESSTWVERNLGGDYAWGDPVEIFYAAGGNQLELAIPLAALGLERVPAWLDFKWADNIQQTGDWSDLTLNGDVAPNDRFNYRALFGQGRE